jgi:hypothetical protein
LAVGCLTPHQLVLANGALRSGNLHVAAFSSPASLRTPNGGPSGLFLDVTCSFAVESSSTRRIGYPRVTARTYAYRLLDHHHRELLVYHWQPGPDHAGPDHPHLHISAALDAQVDAINRREIGLDKLHVATGDVTLAAVVRMLITEFGIAPLRLDWREVLDRIESGSADERGP